MAKKKPTAKSSRTTSKKLVPKRPDRVSGKPLKRIAAEKDVTEDSAGELKKLQASLNSLVKARGPEHPEVAALHLQIGDFWNKRKSYDKALDGYQRALEIKLKNHGYEEQEEVIVLSDTFFFLPKPIFITLGYDDVCYISEEVSGVISDTVLKKALAARASWSDYIYERDWYDFDDLLHTYGMDMPATEIQFANSPPRRAILNYELPEFNSFLAAFQRSSGGDFVHLASSEEKSNGWANSIKYQIELGPGFLSTANIGVNFEDGKVVGYFCLTPDGISVFKNCQSHSSTTKGTVHSLYFNDGQELISVDTADAPFSDVGSWRKSLLKGDQTAARNVKKRSAAFELPDEPEVSPLKPSLAFIPYQVATLPRKVVKPEVKAVTYKEIQIGTQTWMSENLNVDRFANGDLIPYAKTEKEWEYAGESGKPAWCYYEDDPGNGERFGKLYNWFAVTDPRGLAPKGWLIPTKDDWTTLTDYLGGAGEAGRKMKSDHGWLDFKGETGNGNNESGFSALPGGSRDYGFSLVGFSGSWWSSTIKGTSDVWAWELSSNNGWFGSFSKGSQVIPLTTQYWMPGRPIYCKEAFQKVFGLSVRCVKEPTSAGHTETEDKTETNPEAKIGSQIWMTRNLNVDRFSNGDPIPQVKSAKEWASLYRKRKPAWCYYGNNPANGTRYGKLYNWFAVSDPRGLCPSGWHVPSDDEWKELADHLGGEEVAGIKLKSTEGWMDEMGKSGNGTDEFSFSATPAGLRIEDGTFYNVGEEGSWWTSTESEQQGYSNGTLACIRSLTCGSAVVRGKKNKEEAYSVRCIKDKPS